MSSLKGTMLSPPLRTGELCSPSLGMEYLHIWNSVWKIYLFSPFFFICHTLGYNPVLFIWSKLSSFGMLSMPSQCPLKHPHHCVCMCVCCVCTEGPPHFPHSNLFHTHHLYVLLQSHNQPVSSWFLVLVDGIRNQVWAPRVLSAMQYHCLGSLSWQRKEMYMCILTNLCAHT